MQRLWAQELQAVYLSHLEAVFMGGDRIEQGGLSGAEVTGDHVDRQALGGGNRTGEGRGGGGAGAHDAENGSHFSWLPGRWS